MDGVETKEGYAGDNGKGEIFSRPVRAGKRTYFFDVKSTKGNDYYLTITESKKRMGEDGKFFYEKHKLFLYKEDFDKFADGLTEVVAYIKNARPTITGDNSNTHSNTHSTPVSNPNSGTETESNGFSGGVNFEDLK